MKGRTGDLAYTWRRCCKMPCRKRLASRSFWGSVTIDGNQVRYVTVGDGPAGLFLHGWGLRPNAYRGTIEAMAAAGCRVYAPCLPGFGGTRELDADQRTFAGYARWVGHFLDAVGAPDVALAAGHSFGGGVATAFTYDQPERVGSLLLVNAIGSPTWALFPNEVPDHPATTGVGLGPSLRDGSAALAASGPGPSHVARGLHPEPARQSARDVPHRRVHPPGRSGEGGACDRRPRCSGDGGVVRPRSAGLPRPRSTSCVMLPASRVSWSKGRTPGRLPTRRRSASWRSARWSTLGPLVHAALGSVGAEPMEAAN